MKKDFVDIICCPNCKSDLKLKIEKEENDKIIEGTFTCKNCKQIYHIEEGVPNLLPL